MSVLLTIQVLSFLLVSAGLYVLYLRLEAQWHRRRLNQRIFESDSPSRAAAPSETMTAALEMLVRLGHSSAPTDGSRMKKITRRLGFAGYRDAVAVYLFLGIKIALSLAAGGLYGTGLLLTGALTPRSAVMIFFPLAGGYYLPDLLLRRQIDSRQRRIFNELPDAMDLMLICMEAGLSFDMALYRVSRELKEIAPVLSGEFGQYFLEIRGGLPRRKVLENLAQRNGERSLNNLVQVLVQSARFGTDVGQAMRVHAESMRSERQLKAEEKAAKVSTKLTFPTVFFILPALMMIILGPAAINLIERLR